MFRLSTTSIDPEKLKAELADPKAGACATFEGWVRNHHEGRPVTALAYEAYEELALAEGGRLVDEAIRRFHLSRALCVHRTGDLSVGDMAVWVGVSAAHREAAFAACRFLIDEIKLQLPLWKHEHYGDGQPAWQETNHGFGTDSGEHQYYARQAVLPEIGADGQQRLKNSRMLVVGAGGLGCPALQYLASAGIGHITVCDGDTISIDNLHRQVLFNYAETGRNKAEAAVDALRLRNPFIKLTARTERLDADHVEDLLHGMDVVLDCTDNHETRFFLHDACRKAGLPLVQAAIYQFEGQVQTFLPEPGNPCLRCLWPDQPEPECVGNCAETGVLGVVPGVLGALQAQEALKLVLDLPGLCSRDTLLVNLLTMEMNRIHRPVDPHCPLCGTGSSPRAGVRDPDPPAAIPEDWEVQIPVDRHELSHRFRLLDIRRAEERAACPPRALAMEHLPGTDPQAFAALPADQPHLLVCTGGVRSRTLVKRLRAQGHQQFYSLAGGLNALDGNP